MILGTRKIKQGIGAFQEGNVDGELRGYPAAVKIFVWAVLAVLSAAAWVVLVALAWIIATQA